MVFSQIDQNHRKIENRLCAKSCTLFDFQAELKDTKTFKSLIKPSLPSTGGGNWKSELELKIGFNILFFKC